MRLLLFLITGIAWSQSLVLTPNSGSFTQRNTMPADYGKAIVATGSGTWIIGTPSPAPCHANLFWFHTDNGTANGVEVTNANPDQTIYIAPNIYYASTCAPGIYTQAIPFTNGLTTIYYTATLTIVARNPNPTFFNGYGILDSGLSAYGWSAGIPDALSFIYNLSQGTCSNCRPGGTFDLPVVGSTWVDSLGHTITTLTPNSQPLSHQNASKSAFNFDKTKIVLVNTKTGVYSIWSGSGAGISVPSINVGTDFGASGAHGWSATDANSLYSVIVDGFKGANYGTFKRLILGTPPAYTMATGSGEPAGSIFRLDGTKGRFITNSFSRGDINKTNWIGFATAKDYSFTVSTSGTTVTGSAGDPFDSKLSYGQKIIINNVERTISSYTDPTHLELTASAGTQLNVSAYAIIPWYLCAGNLIDIEAAGSAYALVCGDLTAMASPQSNYYQGGVVISNIDSVTGKIYLSYGNSPYDVVGSFTPGDANLVLARSWSKINNPIESTCTNTAITGTRCQSNAHGDVFEDSAGIQWLLLATGNTEIEAYRFSTLADTPTVYEAGGGYTVPLFTPLYGNGVSLGHNRFGGYWNSSTYLNIGAAAVSWLITNCTNTSPAVMTVTATSSTGIVTGNTVLAHAVEGNTACNGVNTVASVSGVNSEIWTLSSNGNGAYVANTGSATKNEAHSSQTQPGFDTTEYCRDLAITCTRAGKHKSLVFSADRAYSAFWGTPRTAPSMDGTSAVFATTGGIPDNIQMMRIDYANIASTPIPNSYFDATRFVTVIPGSDSVVFNYSTPNTGNVVLEVDPVKTILATDVGYQTVTNSSGVNPRSNSFTVSPSTIYYYRIVGDNKWISYGQFTTTAAAPSVTVLGGKAIIGGRTIQ